MYDDNTGEMTTRLKIVRIMTFEMVTFSPKPTDVRHRLAPISLRGAHGNSPTSGTVCQFLEFTPFVVPISFSAHWSVSFPY